MPRSDDSVRVILDYAAARPTITRRRRTIAVIMTIGNGTLALACVEWASRLAPGFGDATSIHGVVVPIVLWKLPLVIIASMFLAIGTRRLNGTLGRVSFIFAWAVVAVWIAIAFLLFRP